MISERAALSHSDRKQISKGVDRSHFEDQGYKVVEHESTITLEPVEHASEWVRNWRQQVALGNKALGAVMDKKER